MKGVSSLIWGHFAADLWRSTGIYWGGEGEVQGTGGMMMSRMIDANFIACQIIEGTCGQGAAHREEIVRDFERLTFGLAAYERDQVAWLVNFRLSAPVL
jgi:hypothetical protein